eukprot:gene5662-9478_t
MEDEEDYLISKSKVKTPWKTFRLFIFLSGLILGIFTILITTPTAGIVIFFIFGSKQLVIKTSHDLIKTRNIVKINVENDFSNQVHWIGIYAPPDTLSGFPYNGQNSNEVKIMWISAYNGTSNVIFHREGELNSTIDSGSFETYKRTDMCHQPANESYSTHGRAWLEPGFFHSVVLKNLQPKKKYFYKVGNEIGGYSEEISFISPSDSFDNSKVSFIHFGDMGSYINGWTTPRFFNQSYNDLFMEEQNWPSLHTVNQIKKEIESKEIDFIFHNGDISYSYGYLYGWDYFGFDTEKLSSKVPYMVSIGNHEYGYFGSPFHTNWTYYDGEDSGGECGVPFQK